MTFTRLPRAISRYSSRVANTETTNPIHNTGTMKPALLSKWNGWNGTNTAHSNSPTRYCTGSVPRGLSVMRFCMIEPAVMDTSASKPHSIPVKDIPANPMPW
ncbi:hypothetical protein SRABI112_04916 [Pseudomonas mediterranea]|nr:hypothetical protein SRABI112_04916 [Pseudomonas mediterranea]